jgi:HEXXH motif-containing protein
MPTIAALVRALHLIKLEDDTYDVSFSEPHIPFSVFVSVPRRHTTTNAIRVAEALVHEAMHLQLTLVEFIVPLVNSDGGRYLSPWRGEYRNAQGILHALYVFRVIERFLHHLLSLPINLGEITSYVCERRSEINAQIWEIQSFQYCVGLTEAGAKFVQQLINTGEDECQPII